MSYSRYCPSCKVDLRGEPIPEKDRKYYPKEDPYFYRVIGIYDMDKDRTTAWRCPDCNHEWAR